MKNVLTAIAGVLAAFFVAAIPAYAVSTFIVPQGGTGKATFTTGIVGASGTNALFTQASTTLSGSGVVSVSNSPVVLGSTPSTVTITGGTNGQVLAWLSGVPTWTASSSVAAGTGISISPSGSITTITNTGVISNSCPGGFLSCSGTNPSSFTLGTLGVGNGGTGATTFGQGWLFSSGGTNAISASTSPTVDHIVATSTTASSIIDGTLQVLGHLLAPIAAIFTPSSEGEFGFDTSDNQLKAFENGSVRVYSSLYFASFSYATSTAWTGTTTRQLGPVPVNQTWQWAKCFTDTGTVQVSFNDGSNRMNWINASTTVGTTTLTTNNALVSSNKRYVDLGTPASSPTQVSCTIAYTIDPT